MFFLARFCRHAQFNTWLRTLLLSTKCSHRRPYHASPPHRAPSPRCCSTTRSHTATTRPPFPGADTPPPPHCLTSTPRVPPDHPTTASPPLWRGTYPPAHRPPAPVALHPRASAPLADGTNTDRSHPQSKGVRPKYQDCLLNFHCLPPPSDTTIQSKSKALKKRPRAAHGMSRGGGTPATAAGAPPPAPRTHRRWGGGAPRAATSGSGGARTAAGPTLQRRHAIRARGSVVGGTTIKTNYRGCVPGGPGGRCGRRRREPRPAGCRVTQTGPRGVAVVSAVGSRGGGLD